MTPRSASLARRCPDAPAPSSRLSLALALVVATAACLPPAGEGGADAGAPREVERASTPVSAASGGDVTTASGVKLSIPSGALPADTVITVVVSEQQVAGYDTQSLVYTFGPEGTVFAQPVAITIPTAATSGYVVYWSKKDKPTEYEPVTTEQGDGAKIGYVRHFSTGFVGAEQSDACAGVTCPARGSTCTSATALVLSGTGTCVAGQCEYPTETINCPNDPASGSAGCQAGACAIDCSNARRDGQRVTDCDGSTSTGCETRLDTDPVNCGGCGIVCTAAERCSSGFCLPASSCRAAFDCVGKCVGAGTTVEACLTQCSATVTGAEATAYAAVSDCIATTCAGNLTEACGSAAVEGACAPQAAACKGPDPDACTTTSECARFGATSTCVEGRCTRNQGNESPGGTRCTAASVNVDCATFGQGASCVDGFCRGGNSGTACTAETVATACAMFGEGAQCVEGFCRGSSSGTPCTPENVSSACANFGPGAQCVAGFCQPGGGGSTCTEATVATDCAFLGPNPRCRDGQCAPSTISGPPCTSATAATDCSVFPGSSCIANICRMPCTEENRATACAMLGQFTACVGGLCEQADECTSGAAGDATCVATWGTGSTCRQGACSQPPPLECVNDATCTAARGERWFCAEALPGGPRQCARAECDASNPCRSPDTCIGHFCRPPGSCEGEGTACPPSARGVGLVCMGNTCVPPPCSSDDTCLAVGGTWSNQQRCRRNSCETNAQCAQIPGATCEGYIPLPYRCSADNTDCTTTRTCAMAITTCDLTRPLPGQCFNPNTGPTGQSCATSSDCPTSPSMCLTNGTPSTDDDFCMVSGQPCTSSADCPPQPWSCEGAAPGRCANDGRPCAINEHCDNAGQPLAQQCRERPDLAQMGSCSVGTCSEPDRCLGNVEQCLRPGTEGPTLTCDPATCSVDEQCGPQAGPGSCLNGFCTAFGFCSRAASACDQVLDHPATAPCLSWQLGTTATPAEMVATCAPKVPAGAQRTALTEVVACLDANAPANCDAACVQQTLGTSCRLQADSCRP